MKKINISEVRARKNRYFHFDHSSLTGTIWQLARWYDVDVEYKGRLTEADTAEPTLGESVVQKRPS